jgi:hypothetical protein
VLKLFTKSIDIVIQTTERKWNCIGNNRAPYNRKETKHCQCIGKALYLVQQLCELKIYEQNNFDRRFAAYFDAAIFELC